MAIIKLPGHGLSNSAAARSKVWMKQLTGVDVSKSDGWAFEGVWAGFGSTVEVADGTWYVSYVEDSSASGRVRGREVRLYQVSDGALEEVREWKLGASPGWALRCRDDIAAIMADPQRRWDALMAERGRLLERLLQIDDQLMKIDQQMDGA